jgi:hypothetical protein
LKDRPPAFCVRCLRRFPDTTCLRRHLEGIHPELGIRERSLFVERGVRMAAGLWF